MMRARIIGDADAIAGVLQHAPHFHACALGPAPDPGTHFRVSIDLFVKTMEEAETELPGRIERLCDLAGAEYRPDEWEVLHLTRRNQN